MRQIMDDSLNLGALLITVEEQADTLGELAELLKEERDHLIRNESNSLLENLSSQEKTLRRIGKLEEQRLKLVESLGGTGLPASPSLTRLAEALEGEHREKLLSLAARIGSCAADVRRLTRRNRRLIESGIKCVQGFLDLIFAPEPAGYGQDGAERSEPRLVERWA
jgi:flagellar biosynthesis/type III secretory pathway chaperone